MALSNESSWERDSLCTEYPKLNFFPSESDTSDVKEAKKVCNRCLVKPECLDYALSTKQPDGIWGGFTTTERKRVSKYRGLVSVQSTPVVLNNTSIQLPKFKLRTAKSFSLRVP